MALGSMTVLVTADSDHGDEAESSSTKRIALLVLYNMEYMDLILFSLRTKS